LWFRAIPLVRFVGSIDPMLLGRLKFISCKFGTAGNYISLGSGGMYDSSGSTSFAAT